MDARKHGFGLEQAMAENAEESFVELHINFKTSLVVRLDDEDFDEYDYVRRFVGNIELVVGEEEKRTEIGEIEVWCIDGSRAQADNLDIVELCDFITQDEYDYAESIYTNGQLDHSIVEDPFFQDVLVLHKIAILPEYRGSGYGLKVTKKVIETMGCQCGAVLLRPTPLQLSDRGEDAEWKLRMCMEEFCQDEREAREKLTEYWKNLGLSPTKHPEIYCISGW